jgi:hypothetical protein
VTQRIRLCCGWLDRVDRPDEAVWPGLAIRATAASTAPPGWAASIGVSTELGQIAFTRIRNGPYSIAATWVSETIAALDAA